MCTHSHRPSTHKQVGLPTRRRSLQQQVPNHPLAPSRHGNAGASSLSLIRWENTFSLLLADRRAGLQRLRWWKRGAIDVTHASRVIDQSRSTLILVNDPLTITIYLMKRSLIICLNIDQCPNEWTNPLQFQNEKVILQSERTRPYCKPDPIKFPFCFQMTFLSFSCFNFQSDERKHVHFCFSLFVR